MTKNNLRKCGGTNKLCQLRCQCASCRSALGASICFVEAALGFAIWPGTSADHGTANLNQGAPVSIACASCRSHWFLQRCRCLSQASQNIARERCLGPHRVWRGRGVGVQATMIRRSWSSVSIMADHHGNSGIWSSRRNCKERNVQVDGGGERG